MPDTYGTDAIPGTTVTTQSAGTVSISAAFEASVALIGGYDASSGSATGGDYYDVASLSEAGDLFGDESELYKATRLAFANGAVTVYAVPVSETSVTDEDPSSETSGELENSPIFDSNVNTEHEITDQNGNDVNVSYDVESETIEGTEGYVNPVNGNFNGDDSASYSLDYDYGDYESAIQDSGVLDETPRYVVALTESKGVLSTLLAELNDRATDFEFMRGIGGGMPEADASDHDDSLDDERAIVVIPSRGENPNGTSVRTTAAVGGLLCGLDLGESSTYEGVNQINSLGQNLRPSDAGDFIDKQVLPLIDIGSVRIAKGITTSTTDKFRRIHKVEIVDEATEITNQIAQDFINAENIPKRRDDFRDSLVSSFESMANQTPPLLAATDGTQPYSVIISIGEEDHEVEIGIGLSVVDVMEDISVTISAGDVILNEGAV